MKKFIYVLILSVSTILSSYAQSTDIVTGKAISFNSKVLGENKVINVFLPLGYAGSTATYPVLYVLDGESHSMYVSGVTNYLAFTGVSPQLIVVTIANTNRNRDFTYTKHPQRPGVGGGGDKFIEFLQTELIPYIDDNYRTVPFKILFGHSLTAMYSIYTMMKHPEIFNGYIGASPYLQYDNNNAVTFAKNNFPKEIKNKFLYFSLGNEPEYINPINEMRSELDKHSDGVTYKYEYFEEENHITIPLKTIYNGLSFIFKDYQVKEENVYTLPITELKEHYIKLKDLYGFEVKMPEPVVNVAGYRLLNENQYEKAFEFFKYNIELYPESANVYDSMGEALEARNELDEALKHYEKAYEKGLKNNDPNTQLYKEHIDNVKLKLNK